MDDQIGEIEIEEGGGEIEGIRDGGMTKVEKVVHLFTQDLNTQNIRKGSSFKSNNKEFCIDAML